MACTGPAAPLRRRWQPGLRWANRSRRRRVAPNGMSPAPSRTGPPSAMAHMSWIISGRHGPASHGPLKADTTYANVTYVVSGFSRTVTSYTEDMPLLAIGPAPLELSALVSELGDRGGADG